MNAPLALLLAAAALAGVCVVVTFVIALIAAPRNLQTGPAVDVARGLFSAAIILVLVVLGATVWGIWTGWR